MCECRQPSDSAYLVGSLADEDVHRPCCRHPGRGEARDGRVPGAVSPLGTPMIRLRLTGSSEIGLAIGGTTSTEGWCRLRRSRASTTFRHRGYLIATVFIFGTAPPGWGLRWPTWNLATAP